MTMVDPLTSDAIRATQGELSLHRFQKSELLDHLSDAMDNLKTAIEETDAVQVNHTFLGYDHPIYGGLTSVLLLISELQSPMDFSPQMLAMHELHRLQKGD